MFNATDYSMSMFDEVSRRYDLGQIVGEPVYEKMGCVNHNFALETEKGVFMVRYQPTIYPWSLKRKELEYAVTDFLHDSGFELETPFYLPNSEGDKAMIIDDKRIGVYRRVPGVTAPDSSWTSDDLVIAAAKYHNAVASFPTDARTDQFHENYDVNGKLSGALDVCITNAILQRTVEEKIVFQNSDLLLNAYDYMMSVGRPNPANIPIHGDVHPGNITYHSQVLNGIIDFGNVKWSSKDGECCRFVDVEPDELQRRIELYRSIGGMSEAEERELVPHAINHKLHAINWAFNYLDKSPERKPKILNDMTRKLRKIMKYHTDVPVGPQLEFI